MRGLVRNRRTAQPGMVAVAAILGSVVMLAGCGAAAITPSPSPTAGATVDPHLTEPVAVDTVYRALRAAGLAIVPTTAADGGGSEPRRTVGATYAGWPLTFLEYGSSAALAAAGALPAGDPGPGDAPFRFVGLNLAVEYGPIEKGRAPTTPDERSTAAAQALADALDPLIGPLAVAAVVPLDLAATAAPAATPTPTTPSPSP